MAFRILYKTLFEVQLLSDYLLPNAEEFYHLSTGEGEGEQMEVLLRHGYNILRYLSVEPTEDCLPLLRGHHMIFRPTPFGFLVAIKVKQRDDGGNLVYEPFISPAPGIRWRFRLRLRNPAFLNFSNIRVRPSLPSNFFFSNIDPGGELSYPYLALPPVNYEAGRHYEMGEWVRASGQVFQAISNIDSSTAPGNPGWVADDFPVAYANYRDQRLLPGKFTYTFSVPPSFLLSSAEFELLGNTSTGGGLISAGGTGEGDFSAYLLDFSEEPTGNNELEVRSPDGYLERKEILIDPKRYNHQDFGLAEIGHEAGLGDFRLLEDSGELRTVSGETKPPVFRIPFRNRATYWQYFLHREEDLSLIDDANFDLFASGRYIVATQPRLLTYAGSQVHLRIDSVEVPLPSPANLMIKPRADKIYSEVYLDKINV